MQPLISIQTVPINIEFKSQRASLEIKSPRPSVNVTRERGKQEIQTTPAKVNIDQTETHASMGLKSAPRSNREYAQNGRAAAQEAASKYVQEGNQLMDSPDPKTAIGRREAAKLTHVPESNIKFIPSVQPQITTEGGDISFDYTMDRLNFDWDIHTRPQLEYIPGSIEFSVSQYPEVVIEYLGSPIYVPPSADPNYNPPSGVNATA